MNTICNSVRLVGHLGRDAEVKTFDSGKRAQVTLATNDIYTNKNGEKVTDVQWHRLVGWGKTAELMEKLFTKGKHIAVEGKLSYREFTGEDGVKRQITEINVRDFQLLSPAKKAEEAVA
ncbi:MAG TPA: single-stranded DNA-binding protein [Bacteroidetes bacterium]|nr:single-stranded DNA-binding protein [Bacteroidota bacterium]